MGITNSIRMLYNISLSHKVSSSLEVSVYCHNELQILFQYLTNAKYLISS